MLKIFLLCVLSELTLGASIEEQPKLILVHGIFRHGEKATPTFYPTDPNVNRTLFPIGFGGLTNNGKLMAYNLGKFLRNTYKEFLGNVYTDRILETRSTDSTRTLMSAQLVLAGMWPPTEIQQWHRDLWWQPIPVLTKPKVEEDLMHPIFCEMKTFTLDKIMSRPEVYRKFMQPYEDMIRKIEENAKFSIKNPLDFLYFYSMLRSESDMNWTMPEWTRDVYPEPLHAAASQVYDYYNYDPSVRIINSGYLLQKILNDTIQKIEGKLRPAERKIFLYSGHETTIGCMLQAIKLWKPHIPSYSSLLLFEIYSKEKNYFVKVLYRIKPTAVQAKTLTIPGCATLCPLEQFINLQKDLLPTESMEQACAMNNTVTDFD